MPQLRTTPIRPRRQALATAVGLALCTLSHPAWAVGFGAGQIVSLLGQPLDFSVQIAGDADPTLLNCLAAEVLAGDSRVDPHSVTSHLEPASARAGAWLRVQTTVAIDEPVVTVVIGAGCTARLSRRYVVFVDPPREHVAASLPSAEALQAAAPEALRPSASSAATPDSVGVADAGSIQQLATAEDASTTQHAASDQRADVPSIAPRASHAPSRRAAVRRSPSTVVAATHPERTSTPALLATNTRSTGTGSRLKLDDEPDFAALTSAASPSVTASETSIVLTGDAARYSALEARLAKLDADSAAASANVDRLRQQLHSVTAAAASAKPESQRSWLWQGLSAVLGLAVALLAWQRFRPAPVSDWRDSISPSADAAAIPTIASHANAALPEAVSAPMELADAAPSSGQAAVPPLPSLPEPDLHPTSAAAAQSSARRVSLQTAGGPTPEELLDVEQQFDFFTALGQDASAVELMQSLIGGDHADHPMPYLKLMEVHRRLGREADYRRVRTAFSERFNAAAPEWQAVASGDGRTIEEYPEQLAALIEAWPTPANAAERLGEWIARSSAAANDDRFDMSAFRDMLFLHTLAREMSLRDSRPVALQPLTFEPTAIAPPEPVAAIAAPEWTRRKAAQQAAGTGVDIELDLEPTSDDEDDGRFDLPLSSSQAAFGR